MKKPKNPNNIRPSKEVCEKCKDHGICIAETGEGGYQCCKVLGKGID